MISNIEKLYFSRLKKDIENYDLIGYEDEDIHGYISNEIMERILVPMNDGCEIYAMQGDGSALYGEDKEDLHEITNDELKKILKKHKGVNTEGMDYSPELRKSYNIMLSSINDSESDVNTEAYSKIDLSSSKLSIRQILNIAIRLFSSAAEDTCFSILMPDETYTVILTEFSHIPEIIGAAILLMQPDHILEDIKIYNDVRFDDLERDAKLYSFLYDPLQVKPAKISLQVCRPELGTVLIDRFKGKEIINLIKKDFIIPQNFPLLNKAQYDAVSLGLDEGKCLQVSEETPLVAITPEDTMIPVNLETLQELGINTAELESGALEDVFPWIKAETFRFAEFENSFTAYKIPENVPENLGNGIKIKKEELGHEHGDILVIFPNNEHLYMVMDTAEFRDMFLPFSREFEKAYNEMISNIGTPSREAPLPDRDMFGKDSIPLTLEYDIDELMGHSHEEESHEYELVDLSTELKRTVQEKESRAREQDGKDRSKQKGRGKGRSSRKPERQEKPRGGER